MRLLLAADASEDDTVIKAGLSVRRWLSSGLTTSRARLEFRWRSRGLAQEGRVAVEGN